MRNVVSIAKGVVVVLEGQADERLQQVARAQHLSIACRSTAELAFQEILQSRPPVVVVVVPPAPDEALRLIHLLAPAARRIPVIAAASAHAEDVERAVRSAGATYYLPDSEWQFLEQVLSAIPENAGCSLDKGNASSSTKPLERRAP